MASEEGVEPGLRVEALRRVKGFLSGTWKEVDESKIVIKKIRCIDFQKDPLMINGFKFLRGSHPFKKRISTLLYY